MLLEGVKKRQENLLGSEKLIKESVCGEFLDCYLGDCESCSNTEPPTARKLTSLTKESGDQEVSYYYWSREYKKEKLQTTFADAKAQLVKQLAAMKRHSFLANVQLRQIRAAKENVANTHAVIEEDFAENFCIKYQNEVMSAYWVTIPMTLFTAVLSTVAGNQYYNVISN